MIMESVAAKVAQEDKEREKEQEKRDWRKEKPDELMQLAQ